MGATEQEEAPSTSYTMDAKRFHFSFPELSQKANKRRNTIKILKSNFHNF